MRSELIPSGKVSLFTESEGDPSHPPILLVMGAASAGVWWPAGLCQRLAERGRFVIRYDHRDTGRSTSLPPGPIDYGVEELAADVVAVLDGYGLARAHLCGMSLGGYLAQLVALAHPQRVATLTLIASERLAAHDPAMPPMAPEVVAHFERAATIDWTDRAAVLDYQVESWRLLHGSSHSFDEAHVRALAEADLDRTPTPQSALNHAQLAGGERWLNRLAEITQPTLVIHGTEDPVLPYAHGQALARELPHAALLTLPGSGHELHPADWPVILDAIERHTA